ncbi:hypothetical protein MtrunA17_Chr3g0098581 [Medicago truncatula]|uniref:Transmembrane protein n=1 Tax=Medicago truncatula TaxID=3880 RepID=A0A396IP25_MEDTR|nr:hypothetical protein MtrunA17_Chr3g0098581 [Medicago truncatula]
MSSTSTFVSVIMVEESQFNTTTIFILLFDNFLSHIHVILLFSLSLFLFLLFLTIVKIEKKLLKVVSNGCSNITTPSYR